MTPRLLIDAIQLVGLLLIVIGVGLLFGWPQAMIVAGVALLVLPVVEVTLLRPR